MLVQDHHIKVDMVVHMAAEVAAEVVAEEPVALVAKVLYVLFGQVLSDNFPQLEQQTNKLIKPLLLLRCVVYKWDRGTVSDETVITHLVPVL
jgi:hypothetical protein